MPESESLTFVRRVLDRAIADVAREEYQRLTERMSPKDQERHVDRALLDLNQLQKGISPDYKSKWTALFYLTWYQPRQIHLAYTALRYVFDNLKQKPPRQVIDFGCGSGAVQIALSILLAEDSPPQNVAVHGIDSSKSMMRIGKDLWRKFSEMVRDSVRSSRFAEKLCRTLDLMTDSCSFDTSYEAAVALHAAREATSSGDCWFTAIHASYLSNRKDMRRVFSRIREEHEPVIELVTFFNRRDPSDPRYFFWQLGFTELSIPFDQKVDSLTEIPRWRRELSMELNLTNRSLLTSFVSWNVKSDNVVMIRKIK